MDKITAAVYESHAGEWTAARRPRSIEDGRLQAFARRLRRGGRVADLGCGPGWYAAWLREHGFRAVALDIAHAMLSEARKRKRDLPLVQGDLTALPFADRSLDGAWASACYLHLPRIDVPLALARMHVALRPRAPVELILADLSYLQGNTRHAAALSAAELELGEVERRLDDDDFAGRLFSFHNVTRARDLMVGAGFTSITIESQAKGFWLSVRARRARTLPDTVGPGLRVLICGLNPSVYSADAGVPFARPGNRFWPAARAAGLIKRDRDVSAAFERGIGFTDIVKRATAGAAELDSKEYGRGLARVERMVRIHQPEVTCFVGLEGWRAAVDRCAKPGWIDAGFGDRPAYLMPSTSGRNAHVSLDDLSDHLRRASKRI